MLDRRNPSRLAPAALSLVWVATALFGLFAMHGLSDHGTMHSAGSGVPFMQMTHHGQSADQGSEVHSPGTPAPHDMDLSDLCIVVLTAGLAALMILVGLRLVDLMPGAAGRRFDSIGGPPRAMRDRDPPSLTALSIRRC